jgi:putative flippase GtrA
MKPLAIIDRHRRFLVFCVVGASGVVINMLIFAFVLHSWPKTGGVDGHSIAAINVSGLLGWFVSVFTNFVLNDRITFADQSSGSETAWAQRSVRYYVSATAAMVVQLVVLNLTMRLVEATGLLDGVESLAAGVGLLTALSSHASDVGWWSATLSLTATYTPETCNLVGIGAGTVANYVLAKRWVFR